MATENRKKILPGKSVHTQSASITIDSGAFSTKSYGLSPIDVYEYIEFIKTKKDYLQFYFNMDFIGSAELTWTNQKIMEDAGLTPMPIFHPTSDDPKYLHKCIEEYDYFAIGGIAHNPSLSLRIRLLDNCWKIICDKDGFPKSKIHGLGLAAPQLMLRYPWASIDTSSYMDYGQYGMVLMPRTVHGKLNYTVPPVKVFVTDRSPKKAIEGQHFESLSKNEQKSFLKYLHSKNIEFGTSTFKTVEKGYKPIKGVEVYANNERTIIETPIIEGISNTNFYRDLLNFFFYMDIAEQAPKYPWAWKPENTTNKLF